MKEKFNKISENIWQIEKEGKMNVPGIVFASDVLFEKIRNDKTIEQIRNVACLPGIINASIAMPDAHQGYGACIGGVAAFDMDKGVISPGLVGYDVNCGVRLLVSNLKKEEFMKKRKEVLNEIYKNVPSGLGENGEFRLDEKELREVLEQGVGWAVKRGYATKEDEERIEDNGCIKNADSSKVSQKARGRGRNQLGTLGSGNHFIEVQEVEKVFDKKTAEAFGLKMGQIVVMIHCGSRGLGHQVASDYIHAMEKEYGYDRLPDRELACAPINSKLGEEYRKAMNAAANFAFANRQVITFQIRKSFKKLFSKSKLEILYDVAHNIAKFERHKINGKEVEVCVHRKGATRSFGPGRKELPSRYRKTGQPILIPGSMGTFSYVLVGTDKAEELSFASTAHGAGRVLSRTYALKNITPSEVEGQLSKHGVIIRAGSRKGMVEEAPAAYKDIDEVARVSHELGLGMLVSRLRPLAVIKG